MELTTMFWLQFTILCTILDIAMCNIGTILYIVDADGARIKAVTFNQ